MEASLEYTHKDTPTSMRRNIIQTFVNLVKQGQEEQFLKLHVTILYGHFLAERSLTSSNQCERLM
jgi:hypothetical protein